MDKQEEFEKIIRYTPDPNPFAPITIDEKLQDVPYTPLEGDYRVMPEYTVLEQNHWLYHFWEYKDGKWAFIYRCSQPVKDQELMIYFCVNYVTEDDRTYYHWRKV